ncbi:LuxR C-terminal-related transcriptional regulator [Streptomyces sp. NBC_01077]|uniref:helix-turn-helix transcriptional regulator n=1 Tax=Streptomyces sp. NBC_01077 TaxID=2903746 RepID=UPI0038656896|nr:LuxR C-terminal-related transcriptional regulator [Streptomyces sp. NBC_01077]WSV43639.1 LuxR C-terminal-related transcriptional regulator [Streptomyces sp. NBC_01077]
MSTVSRMQRWPFVGRQEELDAFAKALADGRGRGFVIYGPAGIGKSRLAEECLAQAVRAGYKSMRATASAAAGTVPLGAIAHLIPEGVDLSDPVRGFADVAAALMGPGRGRRWAVWVDDLHLLDATSVVLLRQLMDAGVIRLVATVRTGEPASDAVNALCHGDAIQRVDLEALDRRKCARLLHEALGAPVGRRTLRHLHEGSGGNVLYLHELTLGAVASGNLIHDGEVWELAEASLAGTPRLTELISTRLASAGQAGRPVLELLASCEPVSLADTEAVASLEVVADLEQAGLIQITVDQRRTRVALEHPLYGEVLRKGIPDPQRQALIREHAERAERYGARRHDDPLHVATWRLAATGTADPGLLIRAATLGFHTHDYAQVTALLDSLPERHQTTDTRLLLGYALIETGKWESAERILSDADEQAADEKEKLEVTLARIMSLFWLGSRTQETLKVVEGALQQVTSQAGRRTLRTIEGYVRVISGEPARGLTLLEEQLEPDPSESYDLNTWLRGALAKTLALAAVGRTTQATAWAEFAYATHVRAEAEEQLVPHPATQLSTTALTEEGRLSEALTVGEQAFSDLMISTDTMIPRIWVAFCLGRAEWQSGHPSAARLWFAEAFTPARKANHINALRLISSYVAATAAELGDLGAARSALAELEQYPVRGYLRGEERLGEAWLLAAQGQESRARRVLLEAAEDARTAQYLTSEVLLLTEVARLGGAEDVVERLVELARTCDGVFTPARSRFAQAIAADDVDQLLAVSAELEDIGADLLAAEAAATAAAALRRRGEPRRATAASNRAADAAARCQGARTPLLALAEATAPLTQREREIAVLAAADTSSKDIAEMLSLSVRTIDNHLHHVYTKLGVTTRGELRRALDTAKGNASGLQSS